MQRGAGITNWIFMALVVLVFVFVLISGGLATADKGYHCAGGQRKFQDECYEFVREPKSWTLAQETCRKGGGDLLRVLDENIKDFLMENLDPYQAWWVGRGQRRAHTGPPRALFKQSQSGINSSYKEMSDEDEEGAFYPFLFCPYVILDPTLHLVNKTQCDHWFFFICKQDIQREHEVKDSPSLISEKVQGESEESSNGSAHIVKRSLTKTQFDSVFDETLHNISDPVRSIENATQAAKEFLEVLEIEIEQPTFDQKMVFLEILLNVSERLLASNYSQNNSNPARIIYICANGVLQSSMSKCADPQLNKTQFASMTNIMLRIIETISMVIGFPDDLPVILNHPMVSTYLIKRTPEQMKNMVIQANEDGAKFVLPGSDDFMNFLKKYKDINLQMSSFSVNPFSSESQENITGAVSSLSLRSQHTEIQVDNLSENIQIFMPRKCDKVSYKNISTASGNAVTTSFNNTISNNTVILIVEPNKNITLKLLLAYQYLPNETFSHYNTTLKWKLTEGSSVQVGYRWLLSPQMLSLGYGTWYVHITPLNLTKKDNVNISIFSFSTKCTYWDKTNNRWGSEGCQVGLQSQPWQTQCLCNHLTFFGSSFFVMPNQVDLSQTAALFATVSKNPVVVALLSVFFGLYLITLVWAWNADKKAQKKRKLTLLDDNHHCAQYYYLFNVQTGHRSGAGTSAKVHVTVRGSDGESDPHHLNDPEKPVFGRGGVDMFLLSTPFSLGELQSIHLWHDNSGGNPAWYLDKVLIQDLQTRRCWHFLCSTWLCSTRGDRMTDRTFHPAKKNEITSFSNIFQSKTSSGFRDEHIWISILDPPQRSPFTRVQRVSCCMCLLLCTMAINIIFWNLPTDSQSPVIIKVGSFHVTWQEIMIGIESGLLMFPINILIITIFRSIKPRQAQSKEKEQDSGISETKMAPVPTLKSLLKDTEDLVTCLSKHATNKVPALDKKLELPSDLIPALELVNGVIMQMQDENNTDPHWIYCSQFVFCSLSHLSESLGSVGENAFPSSADYKQVQHTIAQMLKQVEVICSKQKPQSPPPVAKKKKSKSCWLPWWFVFVGWALLLSISGISTFFTLLYGFFYGKDSSLKWIMSLGLSLFQSIFVLQPLKVVGLAIFFALILKPVENVESDEVQSLLAEKREKNKLSSGKGVP